MWCRVADVCPEGAQPICFVQLVHQGRFDRLQQNEQAPDDVGPGKLDLVPGKKGLQLLLRGLLSVERNDFPKLTFGAQAENRLEIQLRLLNPVTNQPTDLNLSRMHRELCRICGPDTQSHRQCSSWPQSAPKR